MKDYGSAMLRCKICHLATLAQMVYFFGLIFGVFGAGVLSDKFGRKATLGPIGIALGTTGLVSAAMPTVEAFVAVRFVQVRWAIAAVDSSTKSVDLGVRSCVIPASSLPVAGRIFTQFLTQRFTHLSIVVF